MVRALCIVANCEPRANTGADGSFPLARSLFVQTEMARALCIVANCEPRANTGADGSFPLACSLFEQTEVSRALCVVANDEPEPTLVLMAPSHWLVPF
jgi:hypothetical protein